MTPSDIHKLCDDHGIQWDDHLPFMERCKRLTGKLHLDDMDEEQLQDVADDIEADESARAMEKKAGIFNSMDLAAEEYLDPEPDPEHEPVVEDDQPKLAFETGDAVDTMMLELMKGANAPLARPRDVVPLSLNPRESMEGDPLYERLYGLVSRTPNEYKPAGGRRKVPADVTWDSLPDDVREGIKLRLAEKEKGNIDFSPGPAAEIFHGSPTKIEKFETRPHYLADDGPTVFGTPNRAMALTHLSKWTDRDFDLGSINEGPLTMRELSPGALERTYKGKKGYLYKLAPETFKYSPKLMRSERMSSVSPEILEVEEIEDALAALEGSGIRLVRHGEDLEKEAGLNERLLRRMSDVGRIDLQGLSPKDVLSRWNRGDLQRSQRGLSKTLDNLAKRTTPVGDEMGDLQSAGKRLSDRHREIEARHTPPPLEGKYPDFAAMKLDPEAQRVSALTEKLRDMKRPLGEAADARATETQLSGRHSPSVAKIPTTARRGKVVDHPSFDPDSTVYHGVTRGWSPDVSPEASRWVSPHPSVAASYAGRRLFAADRGALKSMEGYTPHIKVDPRKNPGTVEGHIQEARYHSRGGITDEGMDTFEGVAGRGELSKGITHEYKRLPDRRFMLVKGEASTSPLQIKEAAIMGAFGGELEKEAGTRTFTHNDDTYDVEKLWGAKGRAEEISPDSLLKSTGKSWGHGDSKYGWRDVLKDPDKYKAEIKRIDMADLSRPILVHKGIVVDGIHRLVKAKKLGQRLPAVTLTDDDMAGALTKRAGVRTQEILAALKQVATTKPKKEHLQAYSRHAALNLGVAEASLRDAVKGTGLGGRMSSLKDAAHSTFFAAAPPTHHTADDMRGMLPFSHRQFFHYGQGGPSPADLVKKGFVAELEKLGGLRSFLGGLFGRDKDEPQYVRIQVENPSGQHLEHHFVRANYWGLPAGKVESGESPRNAAARELLERTGYEVNPRDLSTAGKDDRGFHVFEASSGNLTRVAKPGEMGGYETKIRWETPGHLEKDAASEKLVQKMTSSVLKTGSPIPLEKKSSDEEVCLWRGFHDELEKSATSLATRAISKLPHAHQRALERGSNVEEVKALEADLKNMDLEKGMTYNMRLPSGRFAVIASARKGHQLHVVNTVLDVGMKPPGRGLPPRKPATGTIA